MTVMVAMRVAMIVVGEGSYEGAVMSSLFCPGRRAPSTRTSTPQRARPLELSVQRRVINEKRFLPKTSDTEDKFISFRSTSSK